MYAAVYHGPYDIRYEEVPIPEIGRGEALLKVESASICGTDLRVLRGTHRLFPPGTVRIPGHETVGRLAKLGQDVHGCEVGQRIFMAPNMGCGRCRHCISGHNSRCAQIESIGLIIDGAFAEYMRIPAEAIQQGNLIPVGEDVDPAVAALIEPFACVLRGQNALHIEPGDLVLILGAGPIGLMHLKLARLRGAGQVIVSEPAAHRREPAVRAGADRVVDPTQEDLAEILAEESSGYGPNVIIVAASAPQAQLNAIEVAGMGTRINFFGGLPQDQAIIQFNSNLIHYKELVLTGTSGCSTHNCRESARIVNSGKVDLSDLITARLPLSQVNEGFAAAQDPRSLKVVLEP